jgi:hypothetical protein
MSELLKNQGVPAMNAIGQAIKYPYPIELPKDGEMPFKPVIGSVMLYVDIEDAGGFGDAITALIGIPNGYEMRWTRNLKGDLRLCALIAYDQHDPALRPDAEYLFELQDLLWSKLPKDAVRLRCSSAKGVAAIAA